MSKSFDDICKEMQEELGIFTTDDKIVSMYSELKLLRQYESFLKSVIKSGEGLKLHQTFDWFVGQMNLATEVLTNPVIQHVLDFSNYETEKEKRYEDTLFAILSVINLDLNINDASASVIEDLVCAVIEGKEIPEEHEMDIIDGVNFFIVTGDVEEFIKNRK